MEAWYPGTLAEMRGPYEGMWNVVRFNWPKYAWGIATVAATSALAWSASGIPSTVCLVVAALTGAALLLPLLASHLIYDRSHLYELSWLDGRDPHWAGTVLNINAGFDETSALIQQRFPRCTLHALDLYDPAKHTEPSIERARKAHAPYPRTQTVAMPHLPFADGSAELILAFLSLHEVRDANERVIALNGMRRALKRDGQLIVTEHLRDAANFVAFNFGFLHFHSKATWMNAFDRAGFRIMRTQRTTPFVTTFILQLR